MADVTKSGGSLMQSEREMIVGTHLLLKNGTSYIMIGNGDLTWWPEYEMDLGWYLAEPPADLETLKVAGQGGSTGGLYARQYVAGTVLVNSSASAQTYNVSGPMKRVSFSGGGKVDANGIQAAQTLDATTDVPVGPLMIPARSVVVLRAASVPPPGDEGPTSGGDGGFKPPPDAVADGPPPDGGRFPSDTGGSGGCGCTTMTAANASAPGIAALAALLMLARARSRARRKG